MGRLRSVPVLIGSSGCVDLFRFVLDLLSDSCFAIGREEIHELFSSLGFVHSGYALRTEYLQSC